MKKNMLFGFVILIAVEASFFLSSCDKIEDPYLPATTGGGDTSIIKVRKVLIEDFTGHKCGNCPDAATTIQTIKGTYGDRVISIALHTNFYATPSPAPSPYTYDFRTSAGDEYDGIFIPVGYPAGMINRRGFPTTTHWKNLGDWANIVDTLLAIAPDAYLKITNDYNSSTRVLNTSVRCEFLNPLNGTYKLIVLLTEDSIIKPQKFYTPAVDSLTYVHRHVLRDCLTLINFGDNLISGIITAGDTAVKNYTYTLPADFKGLAPNENHCSVVAYVYNAATYEVIQAEEKKIK